MYVHRIESYMNDYNKCYHPSSEKAAKILRQSLKGTSRRQHNI